MRTQVLSYGGGIQTVAMIVLVLRGILPRPDYIVIADTSREKQSTWDYLEEIAQPALERAGLRVAIASHELATVDLYSGNGDLLLPVYTETGKLPTFCSNEWKQRVVQRWLRAQGAQECNIWIGFSADEKARVERASADEGKYIRTFPLFERGLSRADCRVIIEDYGWPLPASSACYMCLAGETEVVTRDGIKPISSLSGTVSSLLVPTMGQQGGLMSTGHFVDAPIKSGGVQQLWAITLHKRAAVKVVYATGNHRWIVDANKRKASMDSFWRTTETLKTGDSLRNLRSTPIGKEVLFPLPIMQGFVFGDGTRGQGDRPASLAIQAGKDEALLPLFSMCNPKERINNYNNKEWLIYGLPRTWKDLPDIRESRSFLMGWLAGWFAADGTVNGYGYAILYAADSGYLQFARSVCAVLGIQCSAIRTKTRLGRGTELSDIHEISINSRTVPLDFFLLQHHRDRVEAFTGEARDDKWVVYSVAPTDRIEEVFCATVDGIEAFGLAGGLMTGNCPNMDDAAWHAMKRDYPADFAKAIALEKEIQEWDGAIWLHDSRKPLSEVEFDEAGHSTKPSRYQCSFGCMV